MWVYDSLHLSYWRRTQSLLFLLVEAKFPNQSSTGLPPAATAENPGQVYPKSDPNASSETAIPGTDGSSEPPGSMVLGNRDNVFQSKVAKLDDSLREVIATIEDEAMSIGGSRHEDGLLLKLKGWKRELDGIRTGGLNRPGHGIDYRGGLPAEKGGLFVD